MKKYIPHIIILSFAIMHMLAHELCRLLEINDEMALTLLTIGMIFILGRTRRMRVDTIAAMIVFGPILAYLFAYEWRELRPLMGMHQNATSGSVTCFVTTIATGYLTFLVSRFLPQAENKPDYEDMSLLGVSALIVILIRMGLSNIFEKNSPREMISDDLLYFLINFCLITTTLLVVMLIFAWLEKKKADKEKKNKHLAQFRYMKLNQQVKPHFLFNSLNVLDNLVSAGENEKAGNYIQGLSSLYRYMLDIEERTLIHIQSEMEFVQEYVNLMKVRFPQGIETVYDIPEEYLCMDIVPCTVQLLVENAIKHNIVSAQQPVKISISCDGNSLCVCNNIQLKASVRESTGKGLNYIKQQYSDISEKKVEIINDGKEFKVILPLI